MPFMRQLRILKQDAWYAISSRVNNREPLFRQSKALALFDQVFREAQLRFVFTAQALRLEDDRLSFYIKPEDGQELPAIMKWLKQTFAQRYNRLAGRTGHIWGDRYWSEVLAGEPPEGGGGGAGPATRVRPLKGGVRPSSGKAGKNPDFSPPPPRPRPFPPG
jgi:REP element-mobilizing transposase RayT